MKERRLYVPPSSRLAGLIHPEMVELVVLAAWVGAIASELWLQNLRMSDHDWLVMRSERWICASLYLLRPCILVQL